MYFKISKVKSNIYTFSWINCTGCAAVASLLCVARPFRKVSRGSREIAIKSEREACKNRYNREYYS